MLWTALALAAPALSTVETEHFAVSWGPEADPAPETLDLLFADLELAWQLQVDELGFAPPPGVERVVVHLGSTGGESHEIDFSGGYVWAEDGEHPYLVLSANIIDTYEGGNGVEWPLGLISHEFNHVLQWQAGMESLQDEAFLWEATASFVTELSVGDEPGVEYPSGREFLLNPQVALGAHSFDPERPERYEHQYHTAYFLHHIHDSMGVGIDPIREMWTAGGSVLDALGSGIDGGIEQAMVDFALTHTLRESDAAVADHAVAAAIAAEGWVPDNRVTARIPAEGVNEARVPGTLRPESLAFNRLRWPGGLGGEVVVSVQPNATGTDGTPAQFRTFAVSLGEVVEFEGEATLQVTEGQAVDVVVVSLARADAEEKFGYAYGLTVAADEPEAAEKGGCGCQAIGTDWPWMRALSRR